MVFDCTAGELVPGHTNTESDVYIKTISDGTIRLVSKGLGGVPGNGRSIFGDVSDDGIWVSFRSEASNLVESDNNGTEDTFLANMETGKILRLSNPLLGEPNGRSGTPKISADGSFVVFYSLASNLVDNELSFLCR